MRNEAIPSEVKTPVIEMLEFLASDQAKETLRDVRRGIEREMVRITPSGALSQRPHPVFLGSALTLPYITTDFSEAQLELVTPAVNERSETFETLASLHHFVAANLNEGESMWAASMPPALPDDHDIPIARYGTSNAGMVKARYREGLANRYGKRMQLISGIHYNFSLPDSALTPSARVLTCMKQERQSHTAFINACSQQHMQGYLDKAISLDEMTKLESLAKASLLKQKQLEAVQEVSFEEYVAQKSLIDCDDLSQATSLQPIRYHSPQTQANQAQEKIV